MKKLFFLFTLLLTITYIVGQSTKVDKSISPELLFKGKVFLVKEITSSGDTIFDKGEKKITITRSQHNMEYIEYNSFKEKVHQGQDNEQRIKLSTYHNFYYNCSGYRGKVVQIDTYNVPNDDANQNDFEFPYKLYLFKKRISQKKRGIDKKICYNSLASQFEYK